MQATKLEKESGREIVSLSQQMCRKHERMRARAYQPIKLYTHTNAKKISQHSHNHTHTCTHTLEHESSNNKVITQTYSVHNKLVRIINKQCASTKPETQDYTCITYMYTMHSWGRDRANRWDAVNGHLHDVRYVFMFHDDEANEITTRQCPMWAREITKNNNNNNGWPNEIIHLACSPSLAYSLPLNYEWPVKCTLLAFGWALDSLLNTYNLQFSFFRDKNSIPIAACVHVWIAH